VASHDEDTTTMGVEAGRLLLRSLPALTPEALFFASATPAYLDKNNASTVHAALRLPPEVGANDFGGSLRSGTGAVLAALNSRGTVMVIGADQRDGLPTSADESMGGDGAHALAVGDDSAERPVIAEYLGWASATDEFLDRWRAPGETRSKLWEERFGETRYLSLGADAFGRALKTVGASPGEVGRVAIAGMHARAAKALGTKLGVEDGALLDDLSGSIGQVGSAHGGLLLASLLETERDALSRGECPAGRFLVLINLADGADVIVLRTTEALSSWSSPHSIERQLAGGGEISYAKFLTWRGMVQVEPPRRPEPQRVSSTAAWRSESWKFGFVGSKDRSSGAIHLPPARVSMEGGAFDEMDPVPMANTSGTVVTFTIDRLAYSPSPPIVFAIVDFDGGGRFPVELTDVDADSVRIGDRVEMTFRRLFSADGIHDYFWKARPLPTDQGLTEPSTKGNA
jgi:hydroxymethylglutaryl-CoA synthase